MAALTLPAIIQNYQKMVLKNQFKKTYSTFYTAVKSAQSNLGYPIKCSYWASSPYGANVCVEREPVYNSCIHWTMADGAPLPSDVNGPRDSADCAAFEEELFTKVLKTVKFCDKNALNKGCLTNAYRGTDKIKAEQNPNAEFPPNPSSDFSDSNIKNKYSSWVLTDGTVIVKYGSYKGSPPIYTVDINGHKGPNKWGYDIFTFWLKGNYINGIIKVDGIDYAVEKGGLNTSAMIQQMFK